MFALPFSKAAREKKRLKVILKTTREFIYAHEDLPAFDASNEQMVALRAALAARDGEKCEELLGELDKPKSFQGCREWLDILVVSISVAMAFRAYFYEPFNIPTGSMQPTLYGNHYEPCDNPGVMQTTPLKWLNWLATGRDYKEFVAPFSGKIFYTDRNDGRVDLFLVNAIEEKRICLPKDALSHLDLGPEAAGPNEIKFNPYPQPGEPPFFGVMTGNSWRPITVPAGHKLFQGYDTTGDFLFVNRWLWNFRHPSRGDVMIFSTTGIRGLQQGTHYIKRMTGTPGETLTITNGQLIVDGWQPMEPLRIQQIQNREQWHEKEPAYSGYCPPPPRNYPNTPEFKEKYVREVTFGPATLKSNEYFACGDNSWNSFDSRYWGPVPARNLCGIAGGVFWPFWNHRWGPIK